MERALFTTSSNAGLLPVAIFVMPHEDGIKILLELGNDLNPTILIKDSDIEELGDRLSKCGETNETIELNKSGITKSYFKIEPIDSVRCKVTYIAKVIIPLAATRFKIEREKLNTLGRKLIGIKNVT